LFKRRAAAVGLDGSFAGHSLRSGIPPRATPKGLQNSHPSTPSRSRSSTRCCGLRVYLRL